MGKTCFFFGHREADERLLPVLETTIERLIAEENVRYFYVGGYGGFDRIARVRGEKRKKAAPLGWLYIPCRFPVSHTGRRLFTLPVRSTGTQPHSCGGCLSQTSGNPSVCRPLLTDVIDRNFIPGVMVQQTDGILGPKCYVFTLWVNFVPAQDLNFFVGQRSRLSHISASATRPKPRGSWQGPPPRRRWGGSTPGGSRPGAGSRYRPGPPRLQHG